MKSRDLSLPSRQFLWTISTSAGLQAGVVAVSWAEAGACQTIAAASASALVVRMRVIDFPVVWIGQQPRGSAAAAPLLLNAIASSAAARAEWLVRFMSMSPCVDRHLPPGGAGGSG